MTRWINGDCIKSKSALGLSGVRNKFRKAGSLFDVEAEELNNHSLFSKTSYFIILEVEIALLIADMLHRISCCLYISSDKYDTVIDNLGKLSNLSLICFDSPEANQSFYEHLTEKVAKIQSEDYDIDFLSLSNLSVQSIVNEMKKLK